MELGFDDPEMIDDDESDTKICGEVLQQPYVSVEAAG